MSTSYPSEVPAMQPHRRTSSTERVKLLRTPGGDDGARFCRLPATAWGRCQASWERGVRNLLPSPYPPGLVSLRAPAARAHEQRLEARGCGFGPWVRRRAAKGQLIVLGDEDPRTSPAQAAWAITHEQRSRRLGRVAAHEVVDARAGHDGCGARVEHVALRVPVGARLAAGDHGPAGGACPAQLGAERARGEQAGKLALPDRRGEPLVANKSDHEEGERR
jgi:hypothetical protein